MIKVIEFFAGIGAYHQALKELEIPFCKWDCKAKFLRKEKEKERDEVSKGYNYLKRNNFKVRDEYYTPKILVEPILEYVKPNSTVWCPFDTDDSEFVIGLREQGHEVIATHIWNNEDFFEIDVPECDYIISNPPFTRKLDVFERLYKIGKPFAMLMNLTAINYQEVGDFFLNKEWQLLIPNKKVSFDGNTAAFNTSYICHNMLPKDLMVVALEHNNSRRHFVASRMLKGD